MPRRAEQLVDPDDPSTWPEPVLAWCTARLESLGGSTAITNTLNRELIEGEREFRALFAGTKVLVYHCTRLLDYEVTGIRSQGLRTLTRQLVVERVERAREAGFLTTAQAARLEEVNVFPSGSAAGREDQVCLIMSRTVFAESPGDCDLLLSLWGGEAIYWALADEPSRRGLAALPASSHRST